MDLGLAIMLIVFTGIIMFCVGLATPFMIAELVKRFNIDFTDLNDDD